MARLILLKALSEGERWVTVRPHGPGTEGQPVLIKPDGQGAYRVIGGAGGALNYLRLRGVKSEDSYKQEAKQRAQAKREEAKRQQARDREAGLTESRAKALEAVRAQVGDARVKLVQAVAQALGWKDQDLRFPVENFGGVSESARKAAEKKHAQAIMKKVHEAVEFQRKRLVLDAEARAQAGLGEVPLTSSEPDQLSVQDLDPIQPATNGLGFAPEYAKRAGATQAEIKQEAAGYRPAVEPAKAEQKAERKKLGEQIASELATVRTPPAPLDPKTMVEARTAIDILKAAKEFRAVEGQAKAKVKQVQAAKTAEELEPKGAAVVELDAKPTDAEVLKGLAADLKTLRTRSFLDQFGKTADGQNLGGFIGAGAYNAVNSLSLAVAGQGMIDRSVVDVLGVAGAAQVMTQRLRRDLTARELDELTEAMQSYHVDHYMQASADALREAADLHEQAKEIELGEAANAQDLAAMQELNARRRDLTAQAQRALGTALGEMEANAALLWSLQQPAKTEVPLSLGKTSLESAVTQLRAIGLNQGDYDLDQVNGNALLTLKASALDKLAAPIDRADLDRMRDSQAIIDGLHDEPDWLPGGFADRPDLAMQAKPGVAPRLAKPFDYSAPIEQSVADYIGGRAADGDTPSEIMAGLLSEDIMSRVDNRQQFIDTVNEIAPLYGEDGKMVRAETYARKFDKLADDFVERTYGADRAPLQKQSFAVDKTSIDALHRALAANPEGVAAFKPVGELTAQDETALRRAFADEYAKTDRSVEPLRQKLAALETKEPAKESEGLFGSGVNPEWTAWKQERDQAAEALNKATMDWPKYVKALGSPQAAYASMQDVLRSKVLKGFADHYNTLSKKPLAVGKQAIANDLAHLDALDPGAREKRAAERQRLLDSLRTRVAGRYASGSVLEKEQAARAAERAQEQAQMGMFANTDDEVKAQPPALGERYTLGHAAEQQIAKMMPAVGGNFRPGQKAKIYQPSMSGQYAARQRAIKLIERNKRMELGLGVGSGKTGIALGAFTDLHTQGKVQRGLFAVPSVVVGEFQGTALTMLEPGKFKWMADPGADRARRIAAYKGEGGEHFAVVTHQAIRDDFDTLLAADGMTPSKFDALSPAEQKTTAKRLLDQAGWKMQYLAVDEGHNLLNRQGKKNSHLANVMDAISGNTEYYVSATADPVKNDISEAFDVLRKIEPSRYQDRAAFMRRYKPDTAWAKEGLQREFLGRLYTGKLDPGVKVDKQTVTVPVTPDAGQHERLDDIQAAVTAARLAAQRGEVDVPALKRLAPYAFHDVGPEREREVAERLSGALGVVGETAMQRAINDGAKTSKLLDIAKERQGKPGVVFVHYLDRVQDVAKQLQAQGHRVGTLTGADSSKAKDAMKRKFQSGEIDILIASDAGAVGANLQRGRWLVQYDQPMTAMVHAQRNGRIHRMGQQNGIELIDLVADHPSERRAQQRLREKYGLREIMTSPMDGLDDHGLAGYLNRVRAGKQASNAKPVERLPTDVEAEASRQGELAA